MWNTDESGIPLAGAMIMLAVDIVLYGLLAAWLDNIMPTEYGTRLRPWFCFTPSYWRNSAVAKVRNLNRGGLPGGGIPAFKKQGRQQRLHG